MAKQKTLRILRLPVEGPPSVVTIPNTLEAMQAEVGGNIEACAVQDGGRCTWVDVFVSEEGLYREEALPNGKVPLLTEHDNQGYGYRGPAFVSRLNPRTGDQVDLLDSDLRWLQEKLGSSKEEGE